ncbi:VanZ family protein [Hoyosella sp. G463]|uniref:VanZ family protein n=2 Tax=Lolliginicoccus lacisalsi TaxID=2742202 RepID=A0A927JDC3_9ACTN|nr:VanZ family protein [Lolliginicoccus lacisalsi]MBD8506567.1 VanZ family protein [Lolliginicoccus lacisalsi]
MLFAPAPETSSAIPHIDKAIHAGMFLALAVASRFARIPVFATLVWLLVFAALSEVLQGALPIDRSPDPLDAIADAVGAIMGILLYTKLFDARSEEPA